MLYNDQEFMAEGGVCPCGQAHKLATELVYIGRGAIGKIGACIPRGTRALVVADQNTFAAVGEQTLAALQDAGIDAKTNIFMRDDLHADEAALGEVMLALSCQPQALISVGSGTISDICKYAAYIARLPLVAVASAPSMDGYASNVAPLLDHGIKTTYTALPPNAILCDTAVMQAAPGHMVAAGLGDLLGKYTARADWRLAEVLTGEACCAQVVAAMDAAVARCMEAAPGLGQGQPAALEGLTEGLVMSGIAMQMQGNSRPASGAEHHIAHYWEMLDNTRGRAGMLHGDKVGVGTLMVMMVYETLFTAFETREMESQAAWRDGIREAYGPLAPGILEQAEGLYRDPAQNAAILARTQENWPEFQAMAQEMQALRLQSEALLKSVNGAVRPQTLGYSRADTLNALLYAKEVRERFTVLRLAWLMGRLDEIAEEVCDAFCE